MVRRRHVFYIAGYDPQGISSYHRLFRRELARFQKVWSIAGSVSALETDADGSGRWQAETSGPNWQVTTTYDYLCWDDIVAADMAAPARTRIPRALAGYFENLVNGVVPRMFVATWRFAVFYCYPTLALLLSIAVPVVLGLVAGQLAFTLSGSNVAAAACGLLVLAGFWMLGMRLAHKGYVYHLNDAWLWTNDWVNGRKPELTRRMDEFARHIVTRTRALDVDEVIVVGHSGGAAVAPPVVVRALELDPDFARAVPRFTVMSLGTLLPLLAFHPRAGHIRADIRRLAVEPSLLWIECQARKDVMNFYNYDPMEAISLRSEDVRTNPLVWRVRFRDLLSPEGYGRLRWNFWRMHFQFIMASDRRAPYDYFMFVCGPAPITDWANRGNELVASFAADGSYAERPGSPAAA